MNKPEREGFQDPNEPVELDDAKPKSKAVVAPAPEPDPVPAPVEDEWPLVIKLMHKSIRKSATEELTELTLREPTAMDIIRCGGNPVRIELTDVGGGRGYYQDIIDDVKMMRLMAALSGLLEPQIQKIDPRDYNSVAYRLKRFFLPEQGLY